MKVRLRGCPAPARPLPGSACCLGSGGQSSPLPACSVLPSRGAGRAVTKTKFLLASTQHGGANGRRSRGQTQAGRGGEWWAQVVTGGPAGKGTLTETSGPLTVFVIAQAQGWTCAWRGRLARGEQPLGWGCRAHTVAFTFPLSEKEAMEGGGRWPGGGGLSYVCGACCSRGAGDGLPGSRAGRHKQTASGVGVGTPVQGQWLRRW